MNASVFRAKSQHNLPVSEGVAGVAGDATAFDILLI